MTDHELNEIAIRNGGHAFLMRYIEASLRSYEDILWNQHQLQLEFTRRQRASGGPIASFAYRQDGTTYAGEAALFYDGGPPRYFFAVADHNERNRRLANLASGPRLRIGSAHRKINRLWERLYRLANSNGNSYAYRIRKMQRDYERFASGEHERSELIATAMLGLTLRVATPQRPANPAAPRTRVPGPRTGNTIPGIGPPATGNHVTRSTTQMTRSTTQNVAAASQANRPGGVRPSAPRSLTRQQFYDLTTSGIEAQYHELAPQAYRNQWRQLGGTGEPSADGFLVQANGQTNIYQTVTGAGNGRVRAISQVERNEINRLRLPAGHRMGRGDGRLIYESDWRQSGGQGPSPAYGFIEYDVNRPGRVSRRVLYWRRGIGRPD